MDIRDKCVRANSSNRIYRYELMMKEKPWRWRKIKQALLKKKRGMEE